MSPLRLPPQPVPSSCILSFVALPWGLVALKPRNNDKRIPLWKENVEAAFGGKPENTPYAINSLEVVDPISCFDLLWKRRRSKNSAGPREFRGIGTELFPSGAR
jgi:hypothetical protein